MSNDWSLLGKNITYTLELWRVFEAAKLREEALGKSMLIDCWWTWLSSELSWIISYGPSTDSIAVGLAVRKSFLMYLLQIAYCFSPLFKVVLSTSN